MFEWQVPRNATMRAVRGARSGIGADGNVSRAPALAAGLRHDWQIADLVEYARRKPNKVFLSALDPSK